MKMHFDPGVEVGWTNEPLGFQYGKGVFGPAVEYRSLESIRRSLLDPDCTGPDPVYAIAMDLGKEKHREILGAKHLLFGVVTYAAGTLGREAVRSQGHIHRRARGNKLVSPEIYEIWAGRACILLQENVDDTPGICYAVEANQGDVVIVPPGWAHAAISTDTHRNLTLCALCDRDYAFDYDSVRARGGLAWFPVIGDDGEIDWFPNSRYGKSELQRKKPGDYSQFGVLPGKSLYATFETNPDIFSYVSDPDSFTDLWTRFVP